MSGFGDRTDDDSFDTSPPDPEAVARILWDDLRTELPKRFKEWDKHTVNEKLAIVAAVGLLLARLRREGAI